jgi:Domain of unknown function (DUF4224)
MTMTATVERFSLSEFLSDDDVERLTGYSQVAKQRTWLRDKSIAHTVNARGRPVVMRNWKSGSVAVHKWSPKVVSA